MHTCFMSHQRIRGFLNDMRYINPRFTYLLTYLLTYSFAGLGLGLGLVTAGLDYSTVTNRLQAGQVQVPATWPRPLALVCL